MGQERLRQQHAKELEEKELDLETIKASTQKKVCYVVASVMLIIVIVLCNTVKINSSQSSLKSSVTLNVSSC